MKNAQLVTAQGTSAVSGRPPADTAGPPSATAVPNVEYGLIQAHGHAAIITLFLSILFGTLVAAKFSFPDMMGGQAWLTWGRLRYNHTQGIFFGWLGNAFLTFLYYAVPRLANRPVLNRKLGWTLFTIWNFCVVLPGWALVMAGFSQPLEWAEFPLIVDVFVVIAFLMMWAQFVTPFLRTRLSELYVSSWYIIGGILFTLLAYPVGNFVPELVPGAMGAAFSGLWIHDAVGLYVTPLAVAIAYFVIPAVTRRAIFSHFLSMLGFWTLFFIYPLNGTHHYVYSAIPMDAQKGAIVASAYLGVNVILVVTNLLLSLRGQARSVRNDLPLRFVWTGIIFYLIVSLQGSVQASMPMQRLTHFSDWVIGHSHLAMLGFATFIAAGGIAHIWQRSPRLRYNARAMSWAYWLLLVGVLWMVIDLTAAGLIEGRMWQSALPWLDSVRAMRAFWLWRALSSLPITTGFLAFWIGMATGHKVSVTEVEATPEIMTEVADGQEGVNAIKTVTSEPIETLPVGPERQGIRWLRAAYVISFVAGIGFFASSFFVLGIVPGHALEHEISKAAPTDMPLLTPAEARGRTIYGREGCAYCHTQQVRFLKEDVARFGPPTEAWETKYDYPQVWGTRRVGPELARESGVRSDDWQLTHLYNPRLVIRDSIMPRYPWLFQAVANIPSQEGRDLLAYLQSLGRARTLSGYDHEQAQQKVVPIRSVAMTDMEKIAGFDAVSGSAAQTRPQATFPDLSGALPAEAAKGRALFAQNCASCHGDRGLGDGGAARYLLPHPADLTASVYSDRCLSQALWNGVAGSAMPAWRDLPRVDLRALLRFVQTLNTPKPEPLLMPAVAVTGGAHGGGVITPLSAKTLFDRNCTRCHGAEGAGNGPSAGELAPAPTNFYRQQPSTEFAARVLRKGEPGTAMPAWEQQLNASEREALTRYVRAFYGKPEPIGTPQPLTSALRPLTLQGTPIPLFAQKGWKVLTFWSSECACVKDSERLSLRPLARQYRGRVAFYALASNQTDLRADRNALQRNIVQHQLPYPVLLDADHKVARATGARVTPETLLLDPQNRVVFRGMPDDAWEVRARTGHAAVTHPYLADALAQAMVGKSVTIAQSKCLGCAIDMAPSGR